VIHRFTQIGVADRAYFNSKWHKLGKLGPTGVTAPIQFQHRFGHSNTSNPSQTAFGKDRAMTKRKTPAAVNCSGGLIS